MRKLLFLLGFITIGNEAYSQDNFQFSSYSIDDGLPQNSVCDIIQDRDGFLWMGTVQGLCRFDGYNFMVYKQDPADPHSTISTREAHFYIDSIGRLWMVSFNGLSLYNAAKDNFTNLISYTPKVAIVTENCFFGADGQYIWAGLSDYGIVKTDKHTLRTTAINLEKELHKDPHHLWFKGFLDNGKIWCSYDDVLFTYDTRNNEYLNTGIQIGNIINMNDSEALATTAQYPVLLKKSNISLQAIKLNTEGRAPNITCMLRLSDHEAILGSSTEGLFYVDTKTKKVTRHISETDPGYKIRLYARCLQKDRSGNLWIGTVNEGVKKLAYPFRNFKYYNSYQGSSRWAISVYADSTKLYIGYYGNGFDIFSRKDGFLKNVSIKNKLPSLLNSAYTMAPVAKDKMMVMGRSAVGNENNIPLVYSVADGNLQRVLVKKEKTLAESWNIENYRQFFFEAGGGNLLTNIDRYLVSLHFHDRSFVVADTVHFFQGKALCCCFRDKGNRLWVGTFSGVYCHTNSSWQKMDVPGDPEVKTIAQDRDGNMWLGTPAGIYVLDTQQKVIRNYTEANGLINDHLYGIMSDNDGNIWFSHNKGISEYSLNEKTFRHFSKEDGLQSDEFNVGSYHKTDDGELFFGGLKGVNSFYPREINDNPNKPVVKITNIRLFEQPYKSDTPYWNIHSLTLPYLENSLSFEFSALEFTNPKKNRFAYIMEGLDKDWIKAGDKRFARYAGLRPGRYTFKVKASNNDGVWGDTPALIYITIVPPFWQQAWFIIVCILAFSGSIAGIVVQIQKQQYKKKQRVFELQQKIQAERERISRDLHDNVGTQLSLINKGIQRIIHPLKKTSEDEKNEKLSSVERTAMNVIDNLRETIWALNKNQIQLEEFSDKLKDFANKQLLIYTEIRLQYIENIEDSSVVLGPAEALNLFRICQEAITNAIKYSKGSLLIVELAASKGKYSISVADNGIGFEPGDMNKTGHYGLDNMKFRTGEISCGIKIESGKGTGTKVLIFKK